MTKKQIEKKAREMANKYPEIGYNSKYHREIYSAAMEMAEWLLSHQWVSVEDEHPLFQGKTANRMNQPRLF